MQHAKTTKACCFIVILIYFNSTYSMHHYLPYKDNAQTQKSFNEFSAKHTAKIATYSRRYGTRHKLYTPCHQLTDWQKTFLTICTLAIIGQSVTAGAPSAPARYHKATTNTLSKECISPEASGNSTTIKDKIIPQGFDHDTYQKNLLCDLDRYQLMDKMNHRMHVLGHSLSVGQRLESATRYCSHDTENGCLNTALSPFEKRCLVKAGYLHDIGIGGHGNLPSQQLVGPYVNGTTSRPYHETSGFFELMCLLHSNEKREDLKKRLVSEPFNVPPDELHPYYFIGSKRQLKISDLPFSVTEKELRTIATLAGSHKLFPSLVVNDARLKKILKKESPISIETFLKKLNNLIQMAGLPKTCQNKSLVKMAAALSTADAQSVKNPAEQWIPLKGSIINEFSDIMKPCRPFAEEEQEKDTKLLEALAPAASHYLKEILDLLA